MFRADVTPTGSLRRRSRASPGGDEEGLLEFLRHSSPAGDLRERSAWGSLGNTQLYIHCFPLISFFIYGGIYDGSCEQKCIFSVYFVYFVYFELSTMCGCCGAAILVYSTSALTKEQEYVKKYYSIDRSWSRRGAVRARLEVPERERPASPRAPPETPPPDPPAKPK